MALLLAQAANLEKTVFSRLDGFVKGSMIHLELAFLFSDAHGPAPKSTWSKLVFNRDEDPQVFFFLHKGRKHLKKIPIQGDK